MEDEFLINLAREQYANDDVQVDADADVSRADVGAWVQAWVWVRYPEGSDASN